MHTLNLGCAHGAPKLLALRPDRARKAPCRGVQWRRVVAQHRPYLGRVGLVVSRAQAARIAGLILVTIQKLYRIPGPRPCRIAALAMLYRDTASGHTFCPTVTIQFLYRDTPTTRLPARHDTTPCIATQFSQQPGLLLSRYKRLYRDTLS